MEYFKYSPCQKYVETKKDLERQKKQEFRDFVNKKNKRK